MLYLLIDGSIDTDYICNMLLQNSYLTGQHIAIRGIVEKLMDTELLAKQSEWKRCIKEIREIIEKVTSLYVSIFYVITVINCLYYSSFDLIRVNTLKVEANGYRNTEMWRSHWDLQLYKALECQYIKTLLSLHKHFPNVRVDLVLR